MFLVVLVLWSGSSLGDSRVQQESRSDRGLWDEMRKTNEKSSAIQSDHQEYSDNPLNRFILQRRSNSNDDIHDGQRISSRRSDDGDAGGGGGGFWSQISGNKGKKDDDNVEERETPQPVKDAVRHDVSSEEKRRRVLLRKIAAKLLSRKREKLMKVDESPWKKEHYGKRPIFKEAASVDLTTESPSPTVGILAGPKTMLDFQRLESPIPHDDWNRMIDRKKKLKAKKKMVKDGKTRTTRFRPRLQTRKPLRNEVFGPPRMHLKHGHNRRIDSGLSGDGDEEQKKEVKASAKDRLASEVKAFSVFDMVRSMQSEIKELNEQIKQENERIEEEEALAKDLPDDANNDDSKESESQNSMLGMDKNSIMQKVKEIKLRKEDARMKAIETQIKLKQLQEKNSVASDALLTALGMVRARRKLIREALKQQQGHNSI